jgi:1,4-dihydroxy-2-naphthoyl-CoA synthase
MRIQVAIGANQGAAGRPAFRPRRPAMSQTHRVDYEVRDRVAIIAMNRAPVNAIDHPMIDAIHAAFRAADADAGVRAIILTSALPGMFCGGMDLRMVARGDAQDLRAFVTKFYIGTMDIQYVMTKPTIVAINGPARGAGMTLGITSDIILAADDIDLGYPEINVGVIPAIHYVHLPRQISRHKAFELLFVGVARHHQPCGAARRTDGARDRPGPGVRRQIAHHHGAGPAILHAGQRFGLPPQRRKPDRDAVQHLQHA